MLKPEGDDEQLLVLHRARVALMSLLCVIRANATNVAGTTILSAIKEGGKTIQVCKNCLVVANKTPRSTSTFSPSSRSDSPLPQQQRRYSKPASAPPSRSSSPSRKEDPMLNKILDNLNKLDN
ncbi:hypothetical protein TSAR_007549 [Trichomalopsis sarcophagae]|uniref:Uncharacterized protein n=1 Tax=Trichomalopsis sarcophagae TaxID=543379 RepID=A0A232ESZ5_9HYME|nr:hypothetical protein TSAR_007549 [Trichomalopsis sarcophagae]